MGKIFVSHASNDQHDVELLIEALEVRGVECWYAKRDIPPGADFADEIMRGLKSCDGTLIVLSKESVRSIHVRREVEIAAEHGHILFSVRLLDIALSNELAYFLKADSWLDLDQAAPTKTYDTLAAAIKAGKGIRTRRRPWWLIIGTLFVLAVLAFAATWFFNSRIQEIEARLDTQNLPNAEEDAIREAHIETYMIENIRFSTAKTVQFQMYGFEDMEPSVNVSLYAKTSTGRFEKVGAGSGVPKQTNGGLKLPVDTINLSIDANTGVPLPTDTANLLEELHLCVQFISKEDGEGYQFIKRIQTHTRLDPGQTMKSVLANQDCDATFDFVDANRFTKDLAEQQQIADIERREPFVVVSSIAGTKIAEAEYRIDLTDLGGAADTVHRIRSAMAYVWGSTDRKNWKLMMISSAVQNGRVNYTLDYRRNLPEYVRVCVVTDMTTQTGVFEHEVTFRVDGNKVNYAKIEPSEVYRAVLSTSSKCTTEAEVNAPKVDRVIKPLTEVLGANSSSEFNSRERETAITRLKSGTPMAFGYKINGLQLGMPFDDALKTVRLTLPFAEEVEFPAPIQLGMARIIHFKDGQRFRTATLAEFVKAPALAGASFSFKPDSQPTVPTDIKAHAIRLLGRNVPNRKGEFEDSMYLSWGKNNPQWCDYTSYSEPILVAAFDPLKCSGVYIEARVSRGGRGTLYTYVGLFDSLVAQALSEN